MPRPSPLATLVGAVLFVTACSSGGTPDSVTPAAPLSFTVSGVEVSSAAVPAPALPEDVKTKVLETLDAYVDRAVAAPLRSGVPVGDLAALFTPPALAQVNGGDRAALVDEGLPKAMRVEPLAATARLGALASGDDDIAVVTATIDLRVQAAGIDPLVITRTGDLVLVPDDDVWKIDGYDLSTVRDTATATTTSTARR